MLDNTNLLLKLAVASLVLLIVLVALYVLADYRKHRAPLVQADPSVHYSVGHHLRVVTIPLIRYRLSFKLERLTGKSKFRRF